MQEIGGVAATRDCEFEKEVCWLVGGLKSVKKVRLIVGKTLDDNGLDGEKGTVLGGLGEAARREMDFNDGI